MKLKLLTFVASAMLLPSVVLQANEPIRKSNYDLPAQFSTDRMKNLIYSTSVTPNWIGDGQQFWYQYRTSNGTKYWLVAPAKRERKPLFDEVQMAGKRRMTIKELLLGWRDVDKVRFML